MTRRPQKQPRPEIDRAPPGGRLEATVVIDGERFAVDFSAPADLSIPLDFAGDQPRAFGLPSATAHPVRLGDFVGDTRAGGSVNCELVTLCAHGSGTHTECVGHIIDDRIRVADMIDGSLVPAALVTVRPETFAESNESYPVPHAASETAITARELHLAIRRLNLHAPGRRSFLRALVIRTLPNHPEKRTRDYTGSCPPYLTAEAATSLRAYGVEHLLVDLPSIDREVDGGRLCAHRIFWDLAPNQRRHLGDPRERRTITELCFADSAIDDGCYLLSLQIPPFAADAAPSRPILYRAVSFSPR